MTRYEPGGFIPPVSSVADEHANHAEALLERVHPDDLTSPAQLLAAAQAAAVLALASEVRALRGDLQRGVLSIDLGDVPEVGQPPACSCAEQIADVMRTSGRRR